MVWWYEVGRKNSLGNSIPLPHNSWVSYYGWADTLLPYHVSRASGCLVGPANKLTLPLSISSGMCLHPVG